MQPVLVRVGWLRSCAVGVCLLCLVGPPSAGCSFDGSRLAALACRAGEGSCPDGKRCCEGHCVLVDSCGDGGADTVLADLAPDLDPTVDRDLDGVANEEDNCPQTPNSKQSDGDKDGLGDLCDCAPTDSAFGPTLARIERFDDASVAASFIPVERPDNWSVVGRYYQQGSPEGVQRASHGEIAGRRDLLVLAVVQFTGRGDDGLVFEGQDRNVSLVGVVARASGLSTGGGDGYYCALDQQNTQLVAGKTQGDDLASQRLRLFADVAGPGAIVKPIREDSPYTLTLRLVGERLSCRALLADRTQVEIFAQDDALLSGGVALFTAGASALFESVKVCGTN